MIQVRKLSLLVLVLVLLAGAFIVATPKAALALVANSLTCTNYSDSSHTTAVGGYYLFCDGSREYVGQQTSYRVCQSMPCH